MEQQSKKRSKIWLIFIFLIVIIIVFIAIFFLGRASFKYESVADKSVIEKIVADTDHTDYVKDYTINVGKFFGMVFYRQNIVNISPRETFLYNGQGQKCSGACFFAALAVWDKTDLMKWAYELGEGAFPGTNINDQGIVYTVTNWGEILAVDSSTGDKKWSIEIIATPVENDFFKI